MHELAITESLIECVCEQIGDARAVRITLEIGKLSGVSPDAIRFSFDVCAAGTPLESAELEIVGIGGRGVCRACGSEVEMKDLYTPCVCSGAVEITHGQELKLREVEVM